MKPLSIVLIGAGNVASHLGPALAAAGHNLVCVYSHTLANAQALASNVNATGVDQLDLLPSSADLYLVSVKDDALPEVAAQLNLGSRLVAHTSGTKPLSVLQGASSNVGVFSPLQTFSKGKSVHIRQVPMLIEGPDTLVALAQQLSDNVQRIDSAQRKRLHVAAVFACNFTNHLYAIAETLLAESNLSLDLLKPLIHETAAKIDAGSPADMQTGPAIRKDDAVLAEHLELLKDHKDFQELYYLLSNSIQRH